MTSSPFLLNPALAPDLHALPLIVEKPPETVPFTWLIIKFCSGYLAHPVSEKVRMAWNKFLDEML